MNRDLKSCPCQVLCLHGAEEDLLVHLRSPPDAGAQEARADGNEGVKGERRPSSTFIGVRGLEPKSGLMICARQSLVLGLRLLVFHRMFDGTYRASGRGKAKVKGAVSGIMIASLR